MDKQGTQRPAGPEPQVDAFREACRLANLKVTHQREVIFREMVTAEDHPCVEALYERVRKKIPAVSRDTVYRTLAMLEEAGFVTRVPLSGAARFDGDVAPHHHFHCKGCGAVFDFEWSEFDQLAPPRAAETCGRISSGRVVLEGLCRNCMRSEDDRAAHG